MNVFLINDCGTRKNNSYRAPRAFSDNGRNMRCLVQFLLIMDLITSWARTGHDDAAA